jgi:hypothetical protein
VHLLLPSDRRIDRQQALRQLPVRDNRPGVTRADLCPSHETSPGNE